MILLLFLAQFSLKLAPNPPKPLSDHDPVPRVLKDREGSARKQQDLHRRRLLKLVRYFCFDFLVSLLISPLIDLPYRLTVVTKKDLEAPERKANYAPHELVSQVT